MWRGEERGAWETTREQALFREVVDGRRSVGGGQDSVRVHSGQRCEGSMMWGAMQTSCCSLQICLHVWSFKPASLCFLVFAKRVGVQCSLCRLIRPSYWIQHCLVEFCILTLKTCGLFAGIKHSKRSFLIVLQIQQNFQNLAADTPLLSSYLTHRGLPACQFGAVDGTETQP